jgi:hypothetical protein
MRIVDAQATALEPCLHTTAIDTYGRKRNGHLWPTGDSRQRLVKVGGGPRVAILGQLAADLHRQIIQMPTRNRNPTQLVK